MYTTAIIIQSVATLICFFALLVLSVKRTSSYSYLMLVTCICGFIQNAGYIQELKATTVNEGLIAIRTEYLGGAFEICLITFFMFKYCGHTLNHVVKGILLLESFFILAGVWTWQWNGMFYTDAQYVSDPVLSYIKLGHGWQYYFFAIVTIGELVACLFVLMVSLLKTGQKHMLINYSILMVVVAIPFIGFMVSVSGVLGAFDPTPLSCALAIGLFAVSIANNRVFDVADVVGEKILSDLDNAIIIINSEEGYEYSNVRAKELFPALKNYKRGDAIKEYEIRSLFDNKKNNIIKIDDRTFNINVNKVTDDANREYVGKSVILFDITESNKYIEDMRELVEKNKKTSSNKTAFLANVSHEIRTPVNTIVGMSEILLRDYATPDTKSYFVDIRNAGNTITNLVDDILDYTKIESGNMELIKEKFDMRQYLLDMINLYNFRCTKKGLEFRHETSENIPRYLFGDVGRIKQVMNNIISNAVKYTESGYVDVKISHKNRSDFDIDIILAVEDTGVGITEDDKKKMYENFEEENHTKTVGTEVSGLGLSITKQLVDLMGGVINFNSEPGKGTIFSIILPMKIAEDNNETVGELDSLEQSSESFRTSFVAPDAKILIVDDTKTNLLVMKGLLKETKAQIVTATSGQECLDLIEKERFHILLLDHKMPGMDGIETFRKIRSMDGQNKDIPVIMLTANVTKESKDYYMSEHFTDFLSKPVSSESVINMLYKYLPEHLIKEKGDVS